MCKLWATFASQSWTKFVMQPRYSCVMLVMFLNSNTSSSFYLREMTVHVVHLNFSVSSEIRSNLKVCESVPILSVPNFVTLTYWNFRALTSKFKWRLWKAYTGFLTELILDYVSNLKRLISFSTSNVFLYLSALNSSHLIVVHAVITYIM